LDSPSQQQGLSAFLGGDVGETTGAFVGSAVGFIVEAAGVIVPRRIR
jgi:hypothetical protein